MPRKYVAVAIFFLFISQLVSAQCTTTNFTVAKSNANCSSNGKITVTIPTSTDCSGWIAELVKQGGGGSSSINFPATGGVIDFTSLGPGNYDLRLTNGTTSINYSGNPIAITSTYVDMTYSFATAPPSCPNSSDATVTATIGAGKGTGPFVYKLTRADGTVLTSTPQASRTYTFTGLRGNENVSLAITDQINGGPGCEVTVFRPSYTTANQTFRGLAFNDGVRAFNYYRNCSNTSSCDTIDLVVNLSNVTPARKAKLDENPMNAKIRLNGVFYPLTLAAYNPSNLTAQYKYDPVATGGPILVHNMPVTATFVDVCGDLTANSRVFMSDNYLHVYNLPFNDPATCTTKYALRVESFWDDINFRSINFCRPNTLKIQRRVSENPDYYVDVTPAEMSPMPNVNSNPLSLGYTFENSIAWGRAEFILNQTGKYRIVAKDDCHEVERIVDVNQANPLLYGATVSEGASTLQGTSAINISFGTITYKSPINIKITRKDGATLKEINATGPLSLGGTKYVNFPINAVYTFTDNVARSFTISDLPLGEYNVELSNGSGGCPALPTPAVRTINLTKAAEYAMLDGNNSTQDTPVKVELGCLGSSKIIFNMGKNANANSSGSTELWTATPQGAPIARVATTGNLGNDTSSLSGIFNDVLPGNYLIRVRNIVGGYSPAEASVNKPAFGPWEYSVPVTIPEFVPLRTQTSTVFCTPDNLNTGIINVEITQGSISYPLDFVLYAASDTNALNPITGYRIPETLAQLNIREVSFNNVPLGNYFIRTSTPCYSIDSGVTVSTSGNVPTAQTDNSTICQGSPATLSIFTTQNLYTIDWTVKNSATVIGTGNSIKVTPNETTTYTATYKLKPEYSCSDVTFTSDVTVTVLPLNLNIDVTPTQLDLCGNTSPSITVKNSATGFNYEVVDTNGNSFTPALKKSGTGSDLVFNLTGYSLMPGSNLKIKPTSTNPSVSCTATLDKVVDVVAGSKRADLTVTGSSVCPSIDGTITIAGSELGVEYEVLRSNASLAPVLKKTGTGGNLVFTVPANQLLGASTVFSIRATSTNCTPVLLQNTAIITINTAPTANAGADFTKTCVQNPNGTTIGMQAEAGNTYAWTAVPTASLSLLSSTTVANPIANPIAPTDYTLTVTGANGCKATDKVSVAVNLAAPPVNLGADFSITCTTNPSGKTLGSTITGATYRWSNPVNPNLATTATLAVNPSETTTYTLVATYTNTGCSATDSVIATVDKSRPTADAGTDFTKTCVTNPSGQTIGATAIAGQTYSWSPTLGLSNPLAANPTANPIATTTYTVTTTKTATGCTTTDAVVVTVNTTVSAANAGTDFTKTCISNATGATIGVAPITGISYSWSPTIGLSDATISNPNANPLITTEYTLTTTNDASGCTATDSVKATVDTNVPTVSAGSDFTITCVSNTSGRAIGENPESGYSYVWSPSTGLSNTNSANPVANPTITTTYTVRKTNSASGCWSEASCTVTVNKATPTAQAGDDFTKTCINNASGKEIGVVEVTGVSYSWSPTLGLSESTIANPIANPTNTTIYTLTTTNTLTGCTATDTVEVVVDKSLPVADAGSDFTKTCATNVTGKQIGVTAVAGVTYSWSPSAGLSDASVSNPIANPTVTTTYTLIATKTSTGCTATDSVTATVNSTANPIPTSLRLDNNCPEETVDLTTVQPNSVSGVIYEWWTGTDTLRENQVTNPSNYDTSATVYLWAKSSSGCYSSKGSEVEVQITACCIEQVGTLEPKNSFVDFQYEPADINYLVHTGYSTGNTLKYVLVNQVDGKIAGINDSEPVFNSLGSGYYKIFAMVLRPDISVSNLTVGANFDAVQPSCSNTPYYQFLVFGACDNLPIWKKPNIVALPSGKSEKFVLVNVFDENKIVAISDTNSFSSIASYSSYEIVQVQYTGTISHLEVNNTLKMVSADNLEFFASRLFNQCAAVTTQIDGILYNDVDKNCREDDNTQEGLPSGNIYLKLINSKNEVVQVASTNADNYYYFSFYTDLFDGTYSIIVDDNDSMTDSVSNYPSSWKGNSQTFTVEFGQIVEYLSNTTNFVPMCMQSATEKPAPKKTPNLQGNTYHFCKGANVSSISVDTLPGAIVNWFDDRLGMNATQISPIPNTNVVGVTTYYVSQTINGAESERIEINIEVHALPEQPTVIAGDDFVGAGTTQLYSVVNGTSDLNYTWILPIDWTGSSTTKDITVVVGDKSATLGVTATSSFGCVSPIQQLDVRVVIEDDIEVYNSVSPNGDGDNDIFRIRNIDFYPDNTLSIYNRWGIEVYRVTSYGQNDNFFKGFSDGRSTVSRDVELPEGTYFYTLTYKNTKGIERNLSGYLYIKQ